MNAVYYNTLARIDAGRLLTAEQYRRLSDADYPNALKILAEYGYGDGAAPERVIARETDALIAFIEENDSARDAARALLCRFVYQNAKLLYKSRFVRVDTATLYGVRDDLSGLAAGDYNDLSDTMRETLERLDAAEPEPRTIDAELTKARYAEELRYARKSRSRTLIRYVTADIDMNNILTVLRANALHSPVDAVAAQFIPGGTVSQDVWEGCIGGEPAAVAEMFADTPYADMVAAAVDGGSLAAFEAAADDYLYRLTEAGATSLDTFDAFLRYVLAKLTELKLVNMILTCIKNGARDEIAGRMRSLDE